MPVGQTALQLLLAQADDEHGTLSVVLSRSLTQFSGDNPTTANLDGTPPVCVLNPE
jgi:hypothetical protein